MQQAAWAALLATNLVVEEIRRVAGVDLSVQPIVPKVARLQRLMSARGCTIESVTGFYMLEWENSRQNSPTPSFRYPLSFARLVLTKLRTQIFANSLIRTIFESASPACNRKDRSLKTNPAIRTATQTRVQPSLCRMHQ
jgi:hypothetical protein